MLLAILNKLNHIDVLYSLMGVNEKFHLIIQDPIFTQSLDFTVISSNEDNYSQINSILDRFCSYIIPRIQNNIQSLTVDQRSMDSLLSIGNYINLRKLTLANITIQTATRIFYSSLFEISFSIKNSSVFFLDPSSFIYKLNHQISNLSVIINGNSGREYQWSSSLCIFAKICLIFKNLTHFHYNVERKSIYKPMALSNLHLKTMCYSSSIVHLNIKVKTFNDCLWTLDGHLSQLHTLIVYIEHIHNTSTIIKNTVRCWK